MKKILFTCVFVSFILYACFNPNIVIEASKSGILLWFEQILPTLLPFTILSSLLLKSNFLDGFKKNTNSIAIIITILCGFIFGFPIGAKLSSDFYKNNMLTEKQATFLAISTNNFSPMFVCGFALPLLFETNRYIRITYLLLYLFPLILTTIYLIATYMRESVLLDKNINKQENVFYLDMKLIDACILNGFISLLKICGYIIFFSIVVQIFRNLWINLPAFYNFVLNNFEITNGIETIAQNTISEEIKYIKAIQLLSFGGLSGLAQSASILSVSGLSTYKYIIGKVILSLLLTLLSVIYVSCFSLQL